MDRSSRHAPPGACPHLSTKSCTCNICQRTAANIRMRRERFAVRQLASDSLTDANFGPHVQQALRPGGRLCHPKRHYTTCVKLLMSMMIIGVLLRLYYSDIAMDFKNVASSAILPETWLLDTSAGTRHGLGVNIACCGASIIPSWTTPSTNLKNSSPNTLLDDGGDVPRSTWCFEGAMGHVGIVLRSPGVLSHVSVKVVTHLRGLERLGAFWGVISAAPREVICWGLIDGNAARKKIEKLSGIGQPTPIPLAGATSYRFLPIAQFEYDGRETSPSIQTAKINPILTEAQMEFGLIIIEIRSNWGAHETCLNRVFVHRKE